MPYKKKITPAIVDSLKQRINQHNIVQGIKKQELGLLPNVWAAQNVGNFRQRFYALQGNETGLDQISREQIVRLSRELFFQLPIVGVASDIKAEIVVGNHWNFVWKGDKKYKQTYESFINNTWYDNCCTRGFALDWRSMLRTLSHTIDMDGDVLQLFVRNKHNWPLLQFVGSHRIGTVGANMAGQGGVSVDVNGKPHKVMDGVVYSSDDRPIAFTIKPDEAQIATVGQDPKIKSNPIIISAQDGQLIYSPIVFDKGRGLPALYAAVLYGLQAEDLDQFLMDIAKLEATIAYVVSNDAGQAQQEYETLLNQIQEAGDSGNSNLPAVEPTVHGIKMVKGATINYVKSEGGDVKSFRSQRPSEEIQTYMKNIETKILSCIGVPHQFIYSPETISGRSVNAVEFIIRKSVSERQRLLKRYAKSALAWVLSVAMEEGYIPKDYKSDLNASIDFTMPPSFALDRNNDNKADLELYKAGLISGEDFCRGNDTNFTEVCEKREEEINTLLSYVEATKKKFPKIDEATILNLYSQRGQSTLAIANEATADNSQP